MTKRAIKVAISLIWFAGATLASGLSRLGGRRPLPSFVVLYYHGVAHDARSGFARQMEILARLATVVPAGFVDGGGRDRRRVAITFDDAFCSVSEHAIPELVRHSFPATIFVPVASVGRPPGWVSESGAANGEKVMTVHQLRELPRLIDLGSHTLRHPHLPSVDDGQLDEEIAVSRQKLAEMVGRPVNLFAFPYGEHDARCIRACRRAGYERIFTIEPKLADPGGSDFVRGRVAVEPTDGLLEFHLKARGAYAWMALASAVKTAVTARRYGR